MDQTMTGKICMVTGANSGIGYETAKGLAALGATVIMVCRDANRAKEAFDKIKAAQPDCRLDMLYAELSSQVSIRKLVQDFNSHYDSLHVLVNNAGGVFGKRMQTEERLEWTFAVDYLAPFLLTNLLLPVLKKSAPSHIINLASEAEMMGHIDFDDLLEEKKYSAQKAYAQAKLADIMFTYELARRLEGTGVTANAVHPGLVRTNFGSDVTGVYKFIINLLKPIMLSPEKGAETPIYLASSPEVAGVTGKYFANRKPIRSITESYDEQLAKKLWDKSAQLTAM